ncbi:MAG: DUF115 domain-containing protein [Lachnospiraceae bacterium]|nr:DUF115 domain-containing protein [Lachnospiraceae bacterium]
MNIFDRNLEALKIHNEELYDYLQRNIITNSENVCVETAKNGEKIIKSYGIYLNSRYNPSAEAQKYMQDEIHLPDEAVLVMFGFSNGAFAREFLRKNNKHTSCIVVEPDPAIFMQVMQNIDITDLLSDNRLQLFIYGINDEMLEMRMYGLIKSYNKSTNQHITLPKYGQLYTEKLNDMIDTLNEQYDKRQVEYNTAIGNGAKGCRNTIYNMRFLEGCRSMDDFIGKFPADMPAVLVSAGPSLTKNVNLLKNIKNRAFIMCTDRAFNTLSSIGVEPDMIIGVDYEKPVELFQKEKLVNIPFLADKDFNTKVLEYLKPKDLIFLANTDSMWGRLFSSVGSTLKSINAGGSVATVAIGCLAKWGFKKIILIGQDLALTGEKEHAGNTHKVSEAEIAKCKFLEDIDGNMVPVRYDLLLYLRWIEDFALKNRHIEIIDATEGGVKKKNTSVMSFQSAIDKYCIKDYDIRGIIDRVPRLFEGDMYKKVAFELEHMRDNILEFKKDFNKVIEYCIDAGRMLAEGNYDIKRLREINDFMANVENSFVNSEESGFINKFIVQAEADMADDFYIEADNDIDEAIRLYNKSVAYYEKIVNEIPEIINILDEAIVQIESTAKEKI